MKRIYLFIIILIVFLLIYLFFPKKINNTFISIESKIKIVASFYILADFAKKVGGDKVEVIDIVPFGVESHNFEPSPRDITNIYSSQLFIFNGGGFDSWAEKISLDLKKKGVVLIKMTDNFNLLQNDGNYSKQIKDSNQERNFDPHIWLDPLLAKREVEIIKEFLKKADYQNSFYYEERAKDYLEKLSNLDQDYEKGLENCKLRDVVVSHNAFAYLAKRYNLNIISISGLSPDEEPSLKRIAEISQFIKLKDIKYLFFEPLFSSELAETVAKETGAQILILNPLEGLSKRDLELGKDYLTIMRDNLVNLKIALKCQ